MVRTAARRLERRCFAGELEHFADKAVAAGRYRDVTDVMAAGLRLLQRQEAERAAFIQLLEGTQAEGERGGFLTIDEVCRDLVALIEQLDRTGT